MKLADKETPSSRRARRQHDGADDAAPPVARAQTLRDRFRQCPPLELEQNFIRVVLVLILFIWGVVYAVVSGENVWLYLTILPLHVVFTFFIFAWLYRSPAPSTARVVTVTIADRLTISSMIATNGPWIAPAFFLFPWVDIGNAARYGRAYVLPSTALSLLGLTAIIYFNDYWHSTAVLPVAAGAWLCVLLSPLYSSVFYRRLHAVSEKLRDLATHDPLTRLPNRPYLYQRLNEAIAAAERHNRNFAVMFVDLDNFKRINDTSGHDAGDQALCETASALRQAVRQGDTVARLGGDEFVVLLHDVHCADVPTLHHVADNLRDALANNTAHHVSASVGIAVFPHCGRNAETLIQHSDHAMYTAKAAGKKRCHVCPDLPE